MVETDTLVKSAETRHTPKRSLKVSLKMGLPSALVHSFLGTPLQTILQTPTLPSRLVDLICFQPGMPRNPGTQATKEKS